MSILKKIIGVVFSTATVVTLAIGMLGAAILGIIPGLFWLVGDLLSGGFVSEWIEGPFEVFKNHLRETV
ncbi:MAG: hypothetical protein ILA11_11140 [Butyrivibrio sp.]|nr:hypothetical protein [Butyrivibrio sp.]